MKNVVWYAVLAVSLFLVAVPGGARAQSGPRLDPAFRAPEIYQPTAAVVVQLRNGSRLVLGPRRVEGRDVTGLSRLLPSGQFDEAFNANVSYFWQPQAVVETADDKLLVLVQGVAVLNGREAFTLLRLNADGTHDTSFEVPTLGLSPRTLLALPDGRVLLGGAANRTGGTGLAYSALLRLNADGSIDPGFQANLRDPGQKEVVFKMARQADGKLVVIGEFSSVDGVSRPCLARLTADGALDASFAPESPNPFRPQPYALALQADGKVLVGDFLSYQLAGGVRRTLVRLLPNGALDPGFLSPENMGIILSYYPGSVTLAERADGRIYVAFAQTFFGQEARRLVRLLPSGAYDPDWQFQSYNEPIGVSHLQLLPSGEVLVSGPPALYGGLGVAPTGAALLNANGAYVPGFAPLLHQPGTVASLALQPDGKVLLAGQFTEIQGKPAQGLARMQANGELDAEFSRRSRLAGPAATGGKQVALQPDGSVVVTGNFTSAGGLACWGIARLLPDGNGDASFTSPFLVPTHPDDKTNAGSGGLAVQPDGHILAPGSLGQLDGQFRALWRLLPDGRPDNTFRLSTTGYGFMADLLVLPSGKVLAAEFTFETRIKQFLADGQTDADFTITEAEQYRGYYFGCLARYPDGRVLVGGYFDTFQGHKTSMVARILPDGSVDRTFTAPFLGNNIQVTALALQPNGRVLLSTNAPDGQLLRLLPEGTLDNSFPITTIQNSVSDLLVQPNGAILIAGSFGELFNQRQLGLARLLDNNVLAVGSRQPEATTAAWPVPARGALHLQLEAASRPRQVQLLDALGRPVLTQKVISPALTLNTAALPAGVYLLRVEYQDKGVVTRRVVLE